MGTEGCKEAAAVLGNLMLDLLYEDWRLGKDSSKADERSKQMAGEHNQAQTVQTQAQPKTTQHKQAP